MREIECGIVAEDLLLELPERGPWLDAELVDEHASPFAVDPKGLGLTPAPVQREHELRARTLVERLLAHETFELGDDLAVTSEHEGGIDPIHRGIDSEPVETASLFLDERLIADIAERRTRPLGEGDVQVLQRRLVVPPVYRLPTEGECVREPVDVELAWRDPQCVAAVLRQQ